MDSMPGGLLQRRSATARANHSASPVSRVSRGLLVAILLASAATTVGYVHHPVLGATATWLDDQQYVTDNPLVLNPSWQSVERFLFEVQRPSTVAGYYQPLTMISLMLDSAAGGSPNDLRSFHRTSLGLHIINTVLVIVLLILLFDEPYTAAMVGVLFGVHPLTVEPVSWMAERKTLLATFFALCALIAYVNYARSRARHRGNATSQTALGRVRLSPVWIWYGATGASYALALLSKPTSISLPLLFLLLDYWPLRRLNRGALFEKVPFLAVAALASAVTILSQQNTSVIAYPGEQSFSAVLLTLCFNVVFYLSKMIWPVRLWGYYWRSDYLSATNLAAGVIGTLILVAVTSISLLWTRAFLTGFLFYLVALFPTMGVVRITSVVVSEKYAYLPSLGLLLVLAWGLARCWSWGREPGLRRWLPQAVVGISVLSLGAAEAATTRRYLTVWHDNDALYGHVHAYARSAWFLQSDFGDILVRDGNYEAAAAHYLQAEEDEQEAGVAPHAELQQNLGNALFALGRTDEAVGHYRRALAINPADVATMKNLGLALNASGKLDEAMSVFHRVLSFVPTDAEANNGIGHALAERGKAAEAVAYYRAAAQATPDVVQAHVNLADTLQEIGDLDDAIAEYRIALQLDANDPAVHNNLAAALLAKDMADEAVAHLRIAARLNPADEDVQTNLRRALAARGPAAGQ